MPWKTESVMEQRLRFVIEALSKQETVKGLSERYCGLTCDPFQGRGPLGRGSGGAALRSASRFAPGYYLKPLRGLVWEECKLGRTGSPIRPRQ